MRRPDVLYTAAVEWIDSVGSGDWHEPQQALEHLDAMGCHAVGQVIADDERGIVMVLSTGDAGIVLSSMAIPRQAIISLQRLAPETGE
jgi:hypothetical protein